MVGFTLPAKPWGSVIPFEGEVEPPLGPLTASFLTSPPKRGSSQCSILSPACHIESSYAWGSFHAPQSAADPARAPSHVPRQHLSSNQLPLRRSGFLPPRLMFPPPSWASATCPSPVPAPASDQALLCSAPLSRPLPALTVISAQLLHWVPLPLLLDLCFVNQCH